MISTHDDGGDHFPHCDCFACDDLHGRCRRCGGNGELPTQYVGIRPTVWVPCPDCAATGQNAAARAETADSFVL